MILKFDEISSVYICVIFHIDTAVVKAAVFFKFFEALGLFFFDKKGGWG